MDEQALILLLRPCHGGGVGFFGIDRFALPFVEEGFHGFRGEGGLFLSVDRFALRGENGEVSPGW